MHVTCELASLRSKVVTKCKGHSTVNIECAKLRSREQDGMEIELQIHRNKVGNRKRLNVSHANSTIHMEVISIVCSRIRLKEQ